MPYEMPTQTDKNFHKELKVFQEYAVRSKRIYGNQRLESETSEYTGQFSTRRLIHLKILKMLKSK